MANCPRCGSENPEKASACWNCFAPLQGDVAVRRRPKEEPRRVNRRVHKPEAAAGKGIRPAAILIPLIIIAIIAGGGLAAWKLYLCPEKAVERTMNAFFDAVSEGKYAVAAEYMDTRSRNLFPIDQLASGPMGQQISRFIPKVKDRKFGTVSVSGTQATVDITATMEVTGPQGNVLSKTDTTTYYLVKEEGKWKVDIARQVTEGLKKLPRAFLQQMKMWAAMGGPQTAGFGKLIDQALKGK